MLVQGCLEQDFDALTGECAAPFWTAPPGFFSGMTPDDLAAIVAAVLGAIAVVVVIRVLHRFAESQ